MTCGPSKEYWLTLKAVRAVAGLTLTETKEIVDAVRFAELGGCA